MIEKNGRIFMQIMKKNLVLKFLKTKLMRRSYLNLSLNFIVLNFLFGLFFQNGLAIFEDIDTTHPNLHAITFLENEKIVLGYKENDQSFFKPLQKINRAEALKILMLSADIQILENDPEVFPDISFSDWFSRYVNTAANLKIVKGFADGKFHPAAQISRAEFLKMVIVSFEIPFEEVTADEDWFAPFINVASELRLTPQIDQSPHELISRAEVAEIIFRALFCQKHDFEQKYIYSGFGKASFYNEGFAGKKTASGEIFDPMMLTAAHRTLPFGTRLKVFNEAGEFVVVKINDRGPYHQDRVIDLSQKAFEKLAPISRGVLEIEFEVFSDPNDELATVPEQIRPQLSLGAKNEKVPDIIAQKIEEHQSLEAQKKALVTQKKITKPLFDETVNVLPSDFFENAELHRNIPQKIILGSVLGFSGMANEWGYETAMFFLENLKTGEQSHFSEKLSGKNFLIPVAFFKEGTYRLGLVFDDQTKSRVAEIEVVDQVRARTFFASDLTFDSDLSLEVIPENSKVEFSWFSEKNRLTKLVFSQGVNVMRELFFEDGLSEFEIPYDFFEIFKPDSLLSIDLYQAESLNGTLQKQNTNWKKVVFENFDLVSGFPDKESEKISIHNFARFIHQLKPELISGKILAQGVELPKNVFVIFPDGSVKEFPLIKNGESFSVWINPDEWGSYIFEIVSNKGEILFNRQIYFTENEVLPVFPKVQTFVRSDSKTGVLNWINTVRRKNQKSKLFSSAELDEFAQEYADEMAENKFISHFDLNGNSFEDRIFIKNITGEYGENLSMGTTMKLALAGLENSASHRKNILMTNWKRVGIGVAQSSNDDYYVVQVFGK